MSFTPEYIATLEQILDGSFTGTPTTQMLIDMQQLMDYDPWIDAPLTSEEMKAIERAEETFNP